MLLALSQITSISAFTVQSKIINGQVINETEPFFVSIKSDNVKCSGSLISDRYV